MSVSECLSFEKKLAFHSAPALLGMKCANLISLKNSEFNIDAHAMNFNKKAVSQGLKIRILCSCKSNVLILLYSEKRLSERLHSSIIQNFLLSCGYEKDRETEYYLCRLSERILCEAGFPHEIGVFLDYPYEDIVGFIRHRGKNFKMCGYWKVYGDTEYAERTFRNYDRCREFLCYKLENGFDFYKAIENPQEVLIS